MIKKCIFCNKYSKFKNLDSLESQLNKFNFPYALQDFETLNTKNYLCPNCKSNDRERLYRIYIEKYLKKFNGDCRVLDFAPSDNLQNYLKAQNNIIYRSADLYMENVDDKVDITNMKKVYKNNSFDLVICSHILEHVDDDISAMNEISRVLSNKGVCILMTPIIKIEGAFDEDIELMDVSERWRRFAQDDHVRLYDKPTFLERVNKSKLGVKEYNMSKIGLLKSFKYGIDVSSILYVAHKIK